MLIEMNGAFAERNDMNTLKIIRAVLMGLNSINVIVFAICATYYDYYPKEAIQQLLIENGGAWSWFIFGTLSSLLITQTILYLVRLGYETLGYWTLDSYSDLPLDAIEITKISDAVKYKTVYKKDEKFYGRYPRV